jgi:hypothetical protein
MGKAGRPPPRKKQKAIDGPSRGAVQQPDNTMVSVQRTQQQLRDLAACRGGWRRARVLCAAVLCHSP